MNDLSRLCIHTMTTKPWSLQEACAGYAKAGVRGITVWRQHLENVRHEDARRVMDDNGLTCVSLCRGGFFPADTAAGRQAAIDDNKRAIAEAAGVGAPMVVLVCGAVPGMPLSEARKWIGDGISFVLPEAEAAGVKLAIEPLHPMYADTRSAVVTLRQANDMVEAIDHAMLGVAVDVYHVWWDPELSDQLQRAGGSIFAFHVCDWRVPTRDILNDRALMGAGCIPIKGIRETVERAGFEGWIEAEIFSDEHWASDPSAYVDRIAQAYRDHV